MSVEHEVDAFLLEAEGAFEAVPAKGSNVQNFCGDCSKKAF